MGRIYAGILGPLAFAVVIVRGLIHGADAERTLQVASLTLIGFAVAGFAIGQLAQWIVDESVREKAEQELAAWEVNQEKKRSSTAAN